MKSPNERPFTLMCRYARRTLPGVLLCFALATPGCRDPKVEVYRVAKENEYAPPSNLSPSTEPHDAPPEAGSTATPAQQFVASSGTSLSWNAPSGWQTKELGPMRKGSYSVPSPDGTSSDLSITAFPGAVGGELANVNRWRSQIALAPIDASELPGATTSLTVGDLKFTLVDITGAGAEAKRILGAMVPLGDAMWFFKLSGTAAAVTNAKPAFIAFLQTVKPSASVSTP